MCPSTEHTVTRAALAATPSDLASGRRWPMCEPMLELLWAPAWSQLSHLRGSQDFVELEGSVASASMQNPKRKPDPSLEIVNLATTILIEVLLVIVCPCA